MDNTVGLIGLGKMGKNIAFNMMRNGYSVVAYNRSEEPTNEVAAKGGTKASSVKDLLSRLPGRKVVWVMLPAGEATNGTITELSGMLSKNDIVIDGSNSNFKNSITLHQLLKERGILHLDAGCSGGPSGALNGMCTMIGGDREAFEYLEEMFRRISVKDGCLYVGESGSGHFVKMVHNAIEYGMMQSLAEGLELIHDGPYKNLDQTAICSMWNNGSVIRSYLVELAGRAIKNNGNDLREIAPYVADTGEGRWAIETAIEHSVPFGAITESLFERFRSRSEQRYGMRMLAALRHEFGGHDMKKE